MACRNPRSARAARCIISQNASLHTCSQAGKGIADKVAALLHYWEGKYKHLWEQDKDAYMR